MSSHLVDLYGHQKLRERFTEASDRGTLPSSMLLHGPRGIGKQRLALWLGQMFLCSGDQPRPCGRCPNCRYSRELAHPDLLWIFPRPRLKDSDPSLEDVRDDYAGAIAERVARHGLYPSASGSDGIYVATIRAVVRAASMSPAIATRKVFVIGDAERMVSQEGSDQAANAFLKLLEEPPDDTTLILTSSEPGALLPTIRSRVIAVRVAPLAEAELREFVSDPVVTAHLEADRSEHPPEELVREAAGAPGRLLEGPTQRDATTQAHRLLDAATSKDRAARYRIAFAQSATRARGSFADTLDALTTLLHERVREAANAGDETGATGAAKALEVVEGAKERVATNVNPQLLTASLLHDLSGLLQ
jgi:DNA polymerase-3 subunit delta'